MCGLVARFYNDSEFNAPKEHVESVLRALSKLRHRGPDGEGFLALKGAILSHVRLSIIDLSGAADQPFSSACSRFHIVYNGEIFNFKELREELTLLGVIFRTSSDTEVLLNAFMFWGDGCLPKLNGMFAFVVYDSVGGTFFAARDQFGIKPLYFIELEDSIIFASEVKSLLDFLPDNKINREYLRSYLYESALDFGDGCLFEGVKQVKAGHSFSGIGATQTRWYDLTSAVISLSGSKITKEEYLERINRAVAIRLRSDVEIAYTLSGGMDSSTIFSLAAKQGPHSDLPAFTLIDGESSSPIELDMLGAKSIIEEIGGRLNYVRLPDTFSVDALKASIYSQDFPSWSLAHVTYDQVYSAIKADGFKVLLEGHGNDEILGGYATHVLDCAQSHLKKWELRRSWKACKAYVQTNSASYVQTRVGAGLVFLAILIPRFRTVLQWRKALRSPYASLFPEIKPLVFKRNKHNKLTFMQSTLVELVTRTIIPTVLRTFDRSTMLNSIEMRPPFMDPDIVELSLALDDSLRISNDRQKGILREAMTGLLPKDVINNSVKSGFTNDIRVIADIFTPKALQDQFLHEMDVIGLNKRAYERLFDRYKVQRTWELASVINKTAALLCWAQVFSVRKRL